MAVFCLCLCVSSKKKCSKDCISQLIKDQNITKQELKYDCKVLPPLEAIQPKSSSTGSAGLMVPLALLLDSVQPTFRRPPLYPLVSDGPSGRKFALGQK